MTDLSVEALRALPAQELNRLETETAARFMGGLPWGSVLWGLGNLAVWLSLWPLTLSGLMPLWVAFPIATLNVALCYLPSHEAQHRIIAREGEPLFWLNELVGHLSPLPMLLPYGVARLTHYEHHLHANHPDLDPDIHTKAPNAWRHLLNTIAHRQPGSATGGNYGKALARIGTDEARRAGLIAALYTLAYHAILFGLAWSGFAIEAALIWWLPRILGTTYIQFYQSWAPHHPAHEMGRYRDTRAFRSRVGNLMSSGMQFHILHHLYPRIPLLRHARAYEALRPFLVVRGCRLDGL
jgi:beta-carotene hydroxylase